jgi:hypothetical protein
VTVFVLQNVRIKIWNFILEYKYILMSNTSINLGPDFNFRLSMNIIY